MTEEKINYAEFANKRIGEIDLEIKRRTRDLVEKRQKLRDKLRYFEGAVLKNPNEPLARRDHWTMVVREPGFEIQESAPYTHRQDLAYRLLGKVLDFVSLAPCSSESSLERIKPHIKGLIDLRNRLEARKIGQKEYLSIIRLEHPVICKGIRIRTSMGVSTPFEEYESSGDCVDYCEGIRRIIPAPSKKELQEGMKELNQHAPSN